MTREEAIKEAYGIPVTKAQHEALQILIPELADSEDERIRKEMIYFFTEEIPQCSIKEHADKMRVFISWLEKHKEQKSIKVYDNMDDLIADAMIEEIGKSDMLDSAKHNRIYWINKHRQKPSEKPSMLKMLKEHLANTPKEQLDAEFEALKYLTIDKPAEWSHEDEEHIKSLLARLEGMCKKEATFTQTRFAVSEDIDWLKSISERFVLQPKQEWGEEDKDIINEVASILINDENRADNKGEEDRLAYLAEKIQSLRPQPHKWYIKKGHWYMCIVDKPEYGWTKGKVYQSPEDNRIETNYKGSLTNWPDSEPWFRPATRSEIPDSQLSWKPSDEQMKALKIAVDKLIMQYPGRKIALQTLYGDLKKL